MPPATPSDDPVRSIAEAVLYEGYLLWPYRKSALKNQQRFTFGGVYPPAFEDRSEMQVQALLEADDEQPVEVAVRFLQVVRRQVMASRPGGKEATLLPVEEIEHDGRRWVSWEEAIEREVGPGPVAIAAGTETERLPFGEIRRSWQALRGDVELSEQRLQPGLRRITLRVRNETPWQGQDRGQALRHTLCSTHAVLRAPCGAWVSATDPPQRLRSEVDQLTCAGAWPVLVGDPSDSSTMLACPIILEDHPRIAPESPGDLFDSAEIDQLLVLSILAMTDEEREQMRDSDPRGAEILRRTEALGDEQIMRLNGAIRDYGMRRGGSL